MKHGLHILFWVAFWMVVPSLTQVQHSGFVLALQRSLTVMPIMVVMVWLNLHWLLPRYYFRGRIAGYAMVSLGLILGLSVLWTLLAQTVFEGLFGDLLRLREQFSQILGERPPSRIMAPFLLPPMVLTLVGSTLYETSVLMNQRAREAIQLRQEKTEAELMFLKSQINPHFLFNALNNVYTLTLLKSERAPENLMKLSQMLRYMLYECNAERVLLQQELAYLQHFVDLHRLKNSHQHNVSCTLDAASPDQTIAPLLLVPFVENAFKHSQFEDTEQGFVDIRAVVGPEILHFEVVNSLPKTPQPTDSVGGIGLENVKRQLQLQYPDRHQLRIESSADRFSVTLQLHLA